MKMNLILLSLVFLQLISCVPKDGSLSVTSLQAILNPTPTTGEFLGLTSVQTVSGTKVQLNWNSSNDTNITGYRVYDVSIPSVPRLMQEVRAPANSVQVSRLDPVALYVFRVRATTADGREDSNVSDIGAIPYAGIISASIVSSSEVIVNFNDASNADAGYVYCKVGLAAFEETLIKTITNPTSSNTNLTGLSPGETYTCRFVTEIGSVKDNNTATVTFIPLGTAATLSFTTQPSSGTAGAILSTQPIVKIMDSNGNLITAGPDSTAQVTLTVADNSPSLGTIRGTATVTAVAGVATFSGLYFQEAGVKIIKATKSDTTASTNGSGVLVGTSNQFTISPGPVNTTKSSIAISPSVPPTDPLVADGNSSYEVQITLKDEFNNPIPGIKPQFSSNISGDSLSQPTAVTDSSGLSRGSIATTIADTQMPYRQLAISSPSGLTTVVSAAPFVPGPATKLAFYVQPANSPAGNLGMATFKVAVVDANGNVVTTGTGSNADINITIAANVNGALLSGTSTVTAYQGIAIFSDIGIDKTGTGYKLLASSGTYTTSYSNPFNITAGIPKKIVIAGAQSVYSGSCSTAVTIQLQDNGNNPANASQSTPVVVSGLGSASMYSSNACTGSPLSTTLTFTAGTNLKTVYLKDSTAESISIQARDTSNVLTTGTRTFISHPNKISISALVNNATMNIPAGACSPAIVITPRGDNGVASPLFASASVAITGVASSMGKMYSDSACTQELDATSITLAPTTGNATTISLYLKDPKAEVINLNITDNNGLMTTQSSNQTVNINASNMNLTGPTSVVAGRCSTVFTLTLKDTLGNTVNAVNDTTINIAGLSQSTTGKFYSNSGCTGTAITSSVIIPANSSGVTLYFSDTTSEALNLYFTDPAGKIANSQTVSIAISPAALKITAPNGSSSKTITCTGPFVINTMDGATTPNVTAAISPITVNLTTSGFATGFSNAGKFYSDNACSTVITSTVINTGESAKNIYFASYYPVATLTITATDNANVLTAATKTWSITADKAWLGTVGTSLDSNNDFAWFRTNGSIVSAKQDAPSSIYGLHFDANKEFLYVADYNSGRIIKYDYLNHRFVGWIGRFYNPSNASQSVKGSNQSLYPDLPSPADCGSTTSYLNVPGWCYGGMSMGYGLTGLGGFLRPRRMTDDGEYLYIVNEGTFQVQRYNILSGAYAGWIGGIGSTPSNVVAGGVNSPGALTSGTTSCASTSSGLTPGWCTGGNIATNTSASLTWAYGNGGFVGVKNIASDASYIYVADTMTIRRFDKSTGALAGWIGKVYTTPPTSGASGCTTAAQNTITPGWCTGGTATVSTSKTEMIAGALLDPTDMQLINGQLYVLHSQYGGVVTVFDAGTGAFVKVLPNLNFTWNAPRSLVYDSTTNLIYIADDSRVFAMNLNGTVQGWLGKVSNNSGLSSALGNTNDCSTLAVNANTPGWCLNGTSKSGLEERAFVQAVATEIDNNGKLLVGQYQLASIKKFDLGTGDYEGSLSYQSNSPSIWSNNSSLQAENYGVEDKDFNSPTVSYSDGTYLYVADTNNGRIKKIELATGNLVGWIGATTTSPTGGSDPSCLTMNPMSMLTTWCLGSMPNPASLLGTSITSTSLQGFLWSPAGITGDGTYLYVTDSGLHRISKFVASTGAYVGWVGMVSTTPTGGVTGCTSATASTGTPGWCVGGTSGAGTGDGMLSSPSGITYVASTGYIYVIDANNHRVVSYDATTGAFKGWIGRIGTTPTSGCTPVSNGQYNVSSNAAAPGWCKGGKASRGYGGAVTTDPALDKSGGFSFTTSQFGGISTDGTYLYIANPRNYRIDKFSLTGVWQAAVKVRYGTYTNSWVTNTANLLTSWDLSNGCEAPHSLWVDSVSGNFYVTVMGECSLGDTWTGAFVVKLNLTSGNVIGWQGGILPTNLPTAGDAGCAGANGVTPGWCQGGTALINLKMGQFHLARGISGDSNFIYVTDVGNHRLTRIPK